MNAIVAQCGGPTPVINASLAAVIDAWQTLPGTDRIWGSRHGLQGLVLGDWVDLSEVAAGQLAALADQPGAALGGSRYRPTGAEIVDLVTRLDAEGIEAAFLIGGNGTMAAVAHMNSVARAATSPLRVLGIPKTIDNDLAGTEVTPGYGSAARYLAYTLQEIGLDLCAMRGFDQVVVVEIMGRHAGWLTAATALARRHADDAPHVLLLPEAPAEPAEVLERIDELMHRRGVCVVAAAEGVQTPAGRFWAELQDNADLDPSGQRVFSMSAGVSAYLVSRVQVDLGLRCRQVRPNTAQRASRKLVSPVDRAFAHTVGVAAVETWAAGKSAVMVNLRFTDPGWTTGSIPVEAVIGHERLLPPEYIDATNFDVTGHFGDYARRVAGPLPPAPILWMGRSE